MPFFSIIVPVYKVEAYLQACLDSVRTQTFEDWECLCVEDGSPDHCATLLTAMVARDRRFRLIHQPNAGVSNARNRALHLATGTYITFLDGDDTLLPEALATYYALLTPQFPDVLRVNALTTHENHEGALLSDLPTCELLQGHEALDRIAFPSVLMDGYPFLNIYRRTAFKSLFFNPKMTLEEDTAFAVRLWFEATSARLANVCCYYYRQRPDSAIHQLKTITCIAPILTMIIASFQNFRVRYEHSPEQLSTLTRVCSLKFARFCYYLNLPAHTAEFRKIFRQHLSTAQKIGALEPAVLAPYHRWCLALFINAGWTLQYRPLHWEWVHRVLVFWHQRIRKDYRLPVDKI